MSSITPIRSCQICFQNENNTPFISSNDGGIPHSFHLDCLFNRFKTLQEQGETPDCPTCKEKFPELTKLKFDENLSARMGQIAQLIFSPNDQQPTSK